MLTKGEIISIDYKGNTCQVHVPYFDGAVGGNPFIQQAIFINPPGIYNGYKIGDIVMVGFENQELNQLIVLGKLYLGVEKEMDSRSFTNCQSLNVKDNATIPLNTHIISYNNSNKADIEGGYIDYGSISSLIDKLQALELRIQLLENQLENE